MRIVINLVLLAIIAGLMYVLVASISEPITFKAELKKRKDAVVDQLMDIRRLQDAYRTIKGVYAADFDTLNHVLLNDSFRIIQVYGDPDDPSNKDGIRYDTLYRPAKDSVMNLGINLDSVRYVPFSGGENFEMNADTISYQKTNVPVIEVKTRYSSFMGPYAKQYYARYDNKYDPNRYIKFGDMNSPNTSGNWEN